ncbi:hypothetical protein ACFQ0B_70380 [Nonomuraea thailandensis]
MSVSETPAPVSLDDKYTALDGRVLISGVQALVRLTLEQRRLDQARGLDTRAYVTGYQGSPLGAWTWRWAGPSGSWTRPAWCSRPA